jgi:hypothetical protein
MIKIQMTKTEKTEILSEVSVWDIGEFGF